MLSFCDLAKEKRKLKICLSACLLTQSSQIISTEKRVVISLLTQNTSNLAVATHSITTTSLRIKYRLNVTSVTPPFLCIATNKSISIYYVWMTD